jgi:hypothetical protein
MDFLLEVLIGLLDGSFTSEREYIIDIDKYPKALVCFVTILYSVFLLVVIGLLFIVGTSEMNGGEFFDGLACIIIATVLSSIAIRKVVRTIRHIREKNVTENSGYSSTTQGDLHRFYREEWELRKQYAKKLKIKRILFMVFTGVLFVGAFIGSTVLRNSIIRASQNKEWSKKVFDFFHQSSNEKMEQPEIQLELIKSVNSDYEITYLSDIRYANEPAEINPQLITHIGTDSRTLYIRLKPGRYNVVPFITVTAYDKNGNKLAIGKGSYDGGGDIWSKDNRSEYVLNKRIAKITHEGIMPITLNIAASETDVSYSIVCNGGTSLTPEVNYREVTEVKAEDGKLYITVSGSGLEKDIYVILYKDGAFVDLFVGRTENSYTKWKSVGYAEVVLDVGEIEFDVVEVYD